MRKFLLSAMVLAVAISGCKKDDAPVNSQAPAVTITVPAGGFAVDNMKLLRVNPVVTGDSTTTSFMWTLGTETISTAKNLVYAFDSVGTFNITFTAKNSAGTAKQDITVKVADKTYTNGVTRVLDFFPAPGQFTNKFPTWETGDVDTSMNRKALEQLTTNGLISLGGYGGYIVMGFDHTIVNKPGQPSFIVGGNAFGSWSEAGIIMVSVDANGNGLADDEWYEIAGSEYNSPETIHNYQITYYKPDPNKTATPDGGYMLDTTYIRWKDNQGNSGYQFLNMFNPAPYYPQWRAGDSITFTGTKLTNAGVQDQAGDGSYFTSTAFSYGYADNWNDDDPRAAIKIDWAVDKNGNYVHLPGVDFIKVYTGINGNAGWLGEISTEVTGVKDLNLTK